MIRRLAILPIQLYRRWLSPLKPRCCRFSPTCSTYAIEAISRRGLAVGTLLICWRLLRCHPFAQPGYDPVPAPPPAPADVKSARALGESR